LRRLEFGKVKDLSDLRKLSLTKYGLVNNQLRQKAWPLLLEVSPENINPNKTEWLGK